MQARVAKAAHHQEIGVQAPAFCYEYVGNLVFFACRTVFYRIDAVMPEVMHNLIAFQCVRFR